MAKIVLSESFSSLSRRLRQHLMREYVRPCLEQMTANLNSSKRLNDRIIDSFRVTQTWQGIEGKFSGDPIKDLQAVLGIEDPSSAIRELEDYLIEHMKVKPFFGDTPGVQFGVLSNAEFEELMNQPFGSYISPPSGLAIDWLRWVLTNDNDPVIGYRLAFGVTEQFQKFSRTGRALMLSHSEGGWEIQSHLGGMNFVTEALSDLVLEEEIKGILLSEFLNCLGQFRG